MFQFVEHDMLSCVQFNLYKSFNQIQNQICCRNSFVFLVVFEIRYSGVTLLKLLSLDNFFKYYSLVPESRVIKTWSFNLSFDLEKNYFSEILPATEMQLIIESIIGELDTR